MAPDSRKKTGEAGSKQRCGSGAADAVALLKEYLGRRHDVLLGYLFGSCAAGRMTNESDIDIALLFSAAPIPEDIAILTSEISSLLGREVDIAILNTAPPVLRMQVLKHGTLFLMRDQTAHSRFFIATVNEYDDLKRVRRPIEQNILKGRVYA